MSAVQARDVVVIGGGQAGLAASYYLRRSELSFVILDGGPGPGGAWRDGWEGLRLFSPAQYSSLPGWPMPAATGDFPSRIQVVEYLTEYEQRYDLPVHRPVKVTAVHRTEDALLVQSASETWRARAVVSATGTWTRPFVPSWPGLSDFRGAQLHTASYRRPDELQGQQVLIVGAGNSAAQILAEVSHVADTTWVTRRPPRFLPDDVDGHVLFKRATRKVQSAAAEAPSEGSAGLRDIVMVPPVKEARGRGVLRRHPPFTRFTQTGVVWRDGVHASVDTVIWCTGFRPQLRHLGPLRVRDQGGRVPVDGTRSVSEARLWLLGYGDWTGPASATLIGVGRSAKSTVHSITEWLESVPGHVASGIQTARA